MNITSTQYPGSDAIVGERSCRGTDPRTPMGPADRVPFGSAGAEVARRADRGENTRAVYPGSGRTDA